MATLIGFRQIAFLLAVALVITSGCAGYRWGAQTLYRPDVASVHVPVFRSDSFRFGLGELLTEAVIQEIQTKTPYRIADAESADSILLGRLVTENKRVIAEDQFDVPRIIELNTVAEVQWRGPQGNLIGQPIELPIDDFRLRSGQAEHLLPEAGQSVASTQVRTIEQLAQQIVAQLEMPPW